MLSLSLASKLPRYRRARAFFEFPLYNLIRSVVVTRKVWHIARYLLVGALGMLVGVVGARLVCSWNRSPAGAFGTTSGTTNGAVRDTAPLRKAAAVPMPPSRWLLPWAGEDTTTRLTCQQVKTIAAQLRRELVDPAMPVSPISLARATAEWFDVHGLWALPPDAPIAPELVKHATGLALLLESEDPADGCETTMHLARLMVPWVERLREQFDATYETLAADANRSADGCEADPYAAMSRSAFERLPIHRPALVVTSELAKQAACAIPSLGLLGPALHATVRARLFADYITHQWAGMLNLAALRAYVMLVDPHGAWAPFDEESSLGAAPLDNPDQTTPWGHLVPTSLGMRIGGYALWPLHLGDVLLAIDGMLVVGMSVEQCDERAILIRSNPEKAADQAGAADNERFGKASSRLYHDMVVYRQGVGVLRRRVRLPLNVSTPGPSVRWLRVPYGKGHAAVVSIPAVSEHLAWQLEQAVEEARTAGEIQGLVLDLRRNLGGTTSGAQAIVGLWLPSAPMFPTKYRDRWVLVRYAHGDEEPVLYDGPLAVMVDGATASAAEMIAGGLQAYRRAVVVGEQTYGKGCGQEHIEDDAGVGVLRVSSFVFSLPNGAALQRHGIVPDLAVSFGKPAIDTAERFTVRSAQAWRGPDVRDRRLIGGVPWPPHDGTVGPCRDPGVCSALRALGDSARRLARGKWRSATSY